MLRRLYRAKQNACRRSVSGWRGCLFAVLWIILILGCAGSARADTETRPGGTAVVVPGGPDSSAREEIPTVPSFSLSSGLEAIGDSVKEGIPVIRDTLEELLALQPRNPRRLAEPLPADAFKQPGEGSLSEEPLTPVGFAAPPDPSVPETALLLSCTTDGSNIFITGNLSGFAASGEDTGEMPERSGAKTGEAPGGRTAAESGAQAGEAPGGHTTGRDAAETKKAENAESGIRDSGETGETSGAGTTDRGTDDDVTDGEGTAEGIFAEFAEFAGLDSGEPSSTAPGLDSSEPSSTAPGLGSGEPFSAAPSLAALKDAGDPSKVYLFELKAWEDEIGERTNFLAAAEKTESLDFSVPLSGGPAGTRLYSSFVAAVWDGTRFCPVSNRIFVTNPEVIAESRLDYKDPQTKKGLLIDFSMVADAFELGVKNVIVSINLNHFRGSGISYTFEDRTYDFSKGVVEEYDRVISAFSSKGIQVTAVVLNGWNTGLPELIYPGVSQTRLAHYYGFNTSTKEGFETTRAVAAFLAERYSGENPSCGRVSNWVIGNEINNPRAWNEMGPLDDDLARYMHEFERSFRVFYTAMKSRSANCRIFFSTDYDWNWNPVAADGTRKADPPKFAARAVIDRFNEDIAASGNIDWNLAWHPYAVPMTEPEFWNDIGTGQVTGAASETEVINFANLDVLTDYLKRDEFRDRSGAVRHVILSEQGFTAVSATRGRNDELQAAAFAYSYYIADANPYIDTYILSRQVDAPVETAASCYFGLWTCDSAGKAAMRRKIWAVFRDIDKKNQTLKATEFAKSILGIERWSDIIPEFRYRTLE